MNKKMIPTLVVAGVLTTGLMIAKPVSAFWPFDALKQDTQEEAPVAEGGPFQGLADEEKDQIKERRQERRMHRQEHLEALAEFLGVSVEEVQEALQDGKTPVELAEEQGKDIEEFRTQQIEVMHEHMQEQGFTDEEIAAHDAWQEAVRSWADRTGHQGPMNGGFGHGLGMGPGW